MFKNSFRTSKNTSSLQRSDGQQELALKGIIAVYSGDHTKPTDSSVVKCRFADY